MLMESWSSLKSTALDYIVHRKIMAVLGLYFISSILGLLFFDIDVLIPCFFKTLFHFECYGCGMTTAFIKLLQFDVVGAFETNALLFVVLPIGTYIIFKDYQRFGKHKKPMP